MNRYERMKFGTFEKEHEDNQNRLIENSVIVLKNHFNNKEEAWEVIKSYETLKKKYKTPDRIFKIISRKMEVK